MQSSPWLHPIGWASLMGVATLIAMSFLVSESKNILSIAFGILLAQLIAAVSVLLLSIGQKRRNDEMQHSAMSEQATTVIHPTNR